MGPAPASPSLKESGRTRLSQNQRLWPPRTTLTDSNKSRNWKDHPCIDVFALIGGLLPSSTHYRNPSRLTGILNIRKDAKLERTHSFTILFAVLLSVHISLCSEVSTSRVGLYSQRLGALEAPKAFERKFAVRSSVSGCRVGSSLRTQGKEQVLLVSKPPLNLTRICLAGFFLNCKTPSNQDCGREFSPDPAASTHSCRIWSTWVGFC